MLSNLGDVRDNDGSVNSMMLAFVRLAFGLGMVGCIIVGRRNEEITCWSPVLVR